MRNALGLRRRVEPEVDAFLVGGGTAIATGGMDETAVCSVGNCNGREPSAENCLAVDLPDTATHFENWRSWRSEVSTDPTSLCSPPCVVRNANVGS